MFALGRRLLCNGAGALERVFDDTHSREGRGCGCSARGAVHRERRAKYLESRFLFARDATLLWHCENNSRIHGSDSTPVAHPCPPRVPHRAALQAIPLRGSPEGLKIVIIRPGSVNQPISHIISGSHSKEKLQEAVFLVFVERLSTLRASGEGTCVTCVQVSVCRFFTD